MSIREQYQITEYCHRFLQPYILEGDCCVDATCGNGGDTEFLRRMTGRCGKVYAFDIQEEAVRNTRRRLETAGLSEGTEIILDSHEKMTSYVKEEAAVIMFNFGYLPGGDHRLCTKADVSVRAAESALSILKPGGVLSLCIYSGGDTGYEEKQALLTFLEKLDTKKWLVLMHCFYNRKKDPPLPVFVIRLV